MVVGNIQLDKDGYYHSPNAMNENMAAFMVFKTMMKRYKMDEDEAWRQVPGYLEKDGANIYRQMRQYASKCPSFFDFYTSQLENAWGDKMKVDVKDGSDKSPINTNLDTNAVLLKFHHSQYLAMGEISYKIRRRKVDYLKDITLDIPGHLLVLPHDEFLISLPRNSLVTEHGSLLNIYVSQEPFIRKNYDDPRNVVEDNVRKVIDNNDIKRVIRCYGISYGDDLSAEKGQTMYYQLPVIENESIRDQFMKLIDTSVSPYKKPIIPMFNLVLTLCAYLSTKDPDVEKVLGIIRKPVNTSNPKKMRNAKRDNELYGYNYFDVGRITDTRYNSDSISQQELGFIIRLHKVRRHLRAQWYGPRVDDKPGTEQKIILIEEFWKGGEPGDAFKPKTVEVG